MPYIINRPPRRALALVAACVGLPLGRCLPAGLNVNLQLVFEASPNGGG